MQITSIYTITNTVTFKVYVGVTNSFNRRITEHKRNVKKKLSTKSRLYDAIRKYGWENFVIEIIYQSLDYQFCKDVMEPYFIKEYNSFEAGYNLTFGGEGTVGREITEHTKKLLSEKNKGKIPWNKNKTGVYSEKTLALKRTGRKPKPIRQKMGSWRQGKTNEEIHGKEKALEIAQSKRDKISGEKNPRFGKPGTFTNKTHSDNTKSKLKEIFKDHKFPQIMMICPYCKKENNSGNSKRWHFDNCRFKPFS